MTGAFALLKSLSLIAVVAFALGFVGYLALGHSSAAAARAEPAPMISSGPASDDWNLPKHI
jgi:hypothetical protein